MLDQYLVGDIKSIVVTPPAAGNDFSYTVPAGVRLHIHAVNFDLTTDAIVANRRVSIYVDDGGVKTFVNYALQMHTASNTYTYTFADGFQTGSTILNNFIPSPLASKMVLKPGDILKSVITNLQTDDVFDSITLSVEAFLLP